MGSPSPTFISTLVWPLRAVGETVRLKGTGTKALAIAATRATSRMVRRAMVPVFIWFDGKQRRVPKSERR